MKKYMRDEEKVKNHKISLNVALALCQKWVERHTQQQQQKQAQSKQMILQAKINDFCASPLFSIRIPHVPNVLHLPTFPILHLH